jgi:hypothetical protein
MEVDYTPIERSRVWICVRSGELRLQGWAGWRGVLWAMA